MDDKLCTNCGYEFTPHEIEEVYDPASQKWVLPEQELCDDCLRELKETY